MRDPIFSCKICAVIFLSGFGVLLPLMICLISGTRGAGDGSSVGGSVVRDAVEAERANCATR